MNKYRVLKVSLLTLIIIRVFSVSVFSDAVFNLTGTIPVFSSLNLGTVIGDSATVLTLGSAPVVSAKVADIIVISNNYNGFTLTIDSARGFQFVRNPGSAGTNTQVLPYTLTFNKTAGTDLTAAGFTPLPNLVNLNSNRILTFPGTPAKPINTTFDIELSCASKLLEQGNYDDTLTITMALL